jgi:hypothetical protein
MRKTSLSIFSSSELNNLLDESKTPLSTERGVEIWKQTSPLLLTLAGNFLWPPSSAAKEAQAASSRRRA